MIQLIGYDGVLRVEERFKQTSVGVKARAVEDRVFHPEEFTQAQLQFFVNLLRTADEGHRRQSVAPAVKRLVRCLDYFRVVGKSEIIIGAQIQDGLLVGQIDSGILRTCKNAFRLVQTGLADPQELRFV